MQVTDFHELFIVDISKLIVVEPTDIFGKKMYLEKQQMLTILEKSSVSDLIWVLLD